MSEETNLRLIEKIKSFKKSTKLFKRAMTTFFQIWALLDKAQFGQLKKVK